MGRLFNVFNRLFPIGSLRRFAVTEFYKIGIWIGIIVGAIALCAICGHYYQLRNPPAWNFHHPLNAEKHISLVRHYFTDIATGFVVLLLFGFTIGIIVGLCAILPYFLISEWHHSWKLQEEKLISGIDMHRNPIFPSGSPQKFAAIVIGWTVVGAAGLWLISYPISSLGEWVYSRDPRGAARRAEMLVTKEGFVFIERFSHWIVGFFIIFAGSLTLFLICACTLFGSREIWLRFKCRWNQHRQQALICEQKREG